MRTFLMNISKEDVKPEILPFVGEAKPNKRTGIVNPNDVGVYTKSDWFGSGSILVTLSSSSWLPIFRKFLEKASPKKNKRK